MCVQLTTHMEMVSTLRQKAHSLKVGMVSKDLLGFISGGLITKPHCVQSPKTFVSWKAGAASQCLIAFPQDGSGPSINVHTGELTVLCL